jgi:sterol desaturase/sphingolipid hydroxylase (fatty acid hydroxylase superfamily)
MHARVSRPARTASPSARVCVSLCVHAQDLLGNTLPTLAGPLLLGSHFTTLLAYTCLKLHQSIDAHSGYDLPLPFSPWSAWRGVLDGARAHDFHHSKNVGNFGGYTPFWGAPARTAPHATVLTPVRADWLCGTDQAYRKHLATERSAL